MKDTVIPIVHLSRSVTLPGLSGLERLCGRVTPVAAGDAPMIRDLAAVCADADSGRRTVSGRGLADEVVSRPGRAVAAWLAWDAVGHGRAVGLVTLVTTGPPGKPRHSIGWLLVVPCARRSGIGTALVQVAVDEVRRLGGTEVWVETHAAWPDAIAFWRHLGFTPPPAPPADATRSSGRGAS
jgi:GNAT superfamily N-acetyltransferase